MAIEFIDIHSHILPDVDDGCPDVEASVYALKRMEAMGVSNVFLTPHYCKRRGYVAPRNRVDAAYELLSEAASKEGIAVSLHLGTEMEYSQDGARYIKEGRVNTMGNTNCLLVEFPPYVSTSTLKRWVRELLSIGYVPIIAHIERYINVVKDPECVIELKQIGALIQVNIRSVCRARFRLRRFLKWLISGRYADFLGGDVHLAPIEGKEMDKCVSFIRKLSDDDYVSDLLCENAKKILLRQG